MKVKKNVLSIFQDRLFIGGILLLIQMILMVVFIQSLSDFWYPFYFVCIVLSISMVVWLVRKHDNPSYKMAWIIVILLFPLFGGLFYLFWGNTPLNRAKKLRKAQWTPICVDTSQMPTPVDYTQTPDCQTHLRKMHYLATYADAPLWDGTQSAYFPSGEAQFASMKQELETATKFIFLEYFILKEGEMWNTLLSILVRKAAEGVDVRVLYDDAGSISDLPLHYDRYLRSLGIKATRFNPFIPRLNTYLNNRDHRKICVIDGNVGYMGGINLADEYINKIERFGHWKDTAILIRGKAVAQMTTLFLQLWNASYPEKDLEIGPYMPTLSLPALGYVQPFGDSPLDYENSGETIYMQILNSAKREVWITTPYLALDNEMMTALCTASKSGIAVHIITPGIPDKPAVYAVTRSYYAQLIEAGVQIYEYRPGFIHAKMVVADEDIAVVGTINMDFRSFYLHFECGTVFYGGDMPLQVKQDIASILPLCHKITLDWCRQTPWLASVGASILRVFAPLM